MRSCAVLGLLQLLCPVVLTLFRNPGPTNPLEVAFSDAFSSRLEEAALVKQPSALLVVNGTTLFVSSFLNDAVLRTKLPITMASRFEIFAEGSYCRRDLSRCAILNGPWGLAADRSGRLFVSSFGSDQILVFDDQSGEFLDSLGDSTSLDSPEGIAISPDGETLLVASFLDSRIVAFDIGESSGDGEGDDIDEDEDGISSSSGGGGGGGGGGSSGRSSSSSSRTRFSGDWWTVAAGAPVDLEYMVERIEEQRAREDALARGDLDLEAASSLSTPEYSLDLLHGPEDILFLEDLGVVGGGGGSGRGGDYRFAVSSHYNSSVLVLSLETGTIESVMHAVQGALDVPMGLAIDPVSAPSHLFSHWWFVVPRTLLRILISGTTDQPSNQLQRTNQPTNQRPNEPTNQQNNLRQRRSQGRRRVAPLHVVPEPRAGRRVAVHGERGVRGRGLVVQVPRGPLRGRRAAGPQRPRGVL